MSTTSSQSTTSPAVPGRNPSPDYRRREDHGAGEAIPLVIDGREVGRLPIDAILAPRVP